MDGFYVSKKISRADKIDFQMELGAFISSLRLAEVVETIPGKALLRACEDLEKMLNEF